MRFLMVLFKFVIFVIICFSGILAKRPQAAGTLNLLTDRKDSKSNMDLSEIIFHI